MVRSLFFLFLAVALPFSGKAATNQLPKEISAATKAPEKAVLLSLEPEEEPVEGDQKLYRFKVLGKTELNQKRTLEAVAEIETAISHWDGSIALCFNPRHALQLTSEGHVYDLVLCYECHQLYVYKDRDLATSLGVTGSPKVLNDMFIAAKIPLAHMESPEEIAAARKKAEEDNARWFEGMPKSIRPLWKDSFDSDFSPDLTPLRKALARAYPETQSRILALFKWYGSGAGPWSGYPMSEGIAETLLFDFSTQNLVAAAQTNLNQQQMEGAARLFAGWDFSQKRANDLKKLPPDLKKKLLTYSLKSPVEDKRNRAEDAFKQ